MFKKWEIEKLFTITVDNAAANDTAVNYLADNIVKWGHGVLKCKHIHVRCVAHVINLIVVDGLKEIGTSMKKVREAIQYVRGSTSRIKKFKECCEAENIKSKALLSLDVSTSWNSTYLMLETAKSLS